MTCDKCEVIRHCTEEHRLTFCGTWTGHNNDCYHVEPCPKHGAVDELIAQVKSARKFISYARYELEAKSVDFRQFPSQGDADNILTKFDELLARLKEQA